MHIYKTNFFFYVKIRQVVFKKLTYACVGGRVHIQTKHRGKFKKKNKK